MFKVQQNEGKDRTASFKIEDFNLQDSAGSSGEKIFLLTFEAFEFLQFRISGKKELKVDRAL